MSRVRYREGWELVLKELACLGLVGLNLTNPFDIVGKILISKISQF